MPGIKRMPGETQEDARLRAQKEWLAAEPARKREEEKSKRGLNTAFLFWTVCRHKRCSRARACRGDVQPCFDRCWPHVPEASKVLFRAYVTAAGRDKLPKEEAVRHAKQEVARWHDMEAGFARREAERALSPSWPGLSRPSTS